MVSLRRFFACWRWREKWDYGATGRVDVGAQLVSHLQVSAPTWRFEANEGRVCRRRATCPFVHAKIGDDSNQIKIGELQKEVNEAYEQLAAAQKCMGTLQAVLEGRERETKRRELEREREEKERQREQKRASEKERKREQERARERARARERVSERKRGNRRKE